MGRSKRGRDSLRRTPGRKRLAKRIYLICEGHTEKNVVDQMRQMYRLRGVKIITITQGEGPKKVVKRAQDEKRKNRFDKDDEFWVAFDRDQHEGWDEALEQARRDGFHLAVSNPCVELWGILLYEDQFAHLKRTTAQKRLSELHKTYDHSKNPYISLDHVPGLDSALGEADTRAETLLERVRQRGEERGNPTTRFHEFIRALRDGAAR